MVHIFIKYTQYVTQKIVDIVVNGLWLRRTDLYSHAPYSSTMLFFLSHSSYNFSYFISLSLPSFIYGLNQNIINTTLFLPIRLQHVCLALNMGYPVLGYVNNDSLLSAVILLN